MNYIGVDIGGTKIYVGRFEGVDFKEMACKKIETNAEAGMRVVLTEIIEVIMELKNDDTQAVGIGIPGLIDHKKQTVVHTPNVKLKSPICLTEYLEPIGLPTFVENDVNLLALAEAKLNYRDAESLLAVALGTGVGGGVILDGEIYRGHNGFAAEFGHMVIGTDDDGTPFTFEHVCSGTAIERFMGEDGLTLGAAAAKGNAEAVEFFKQFGVYLGVGLSNLVQIFNPQTIVLGGSVTNQFNLYERTMRDTLEYLTTEAQQQDLIIKKASVPHAGAVGAAMLAQMCV